MMKVRTGMVILLILKEIIMKKILIFAMIFLFAGCMDSQSTQKQDKGRHDKGSSSHGDSHGDSHGRDNYGR